VCAADARYKYTRILFCERRLRMEQLCGYRYENVRVEIVILTWQTGRKFIIRHRIICLSCAHWSLKLLNDSIFVPPAVIYSLFHGFSSIPTAVAPSLSMDQRHGTCSKTICVSRTCKWTVFVVHRRRVFLISTRHIERIRGALCDDALCKLTFTFTVHQDKLEKVHRPM